MTSMNRVAILFLLVLCLTPYSLAQAPNITQMANAASRETNRFCPGGLALVSGTNVGPVTQVQFPNSVPGLSVKVGGRNAFIAFASSDTLRIQIPTELPTGATTVIVEYQGQQSNAFPIQLNTYAHAIITADGTGTGVADAWAAYCYSRIDTNNPAVAGQLLRVSAVGLGQTNPAVATGTPASFIPLAFTSTTPKVKIAGREAEAVRAYLTPGSIGVYTIEFTVPHDTGLNSANQSLWLELGGTSTVQQGVRLPFSSDLPPVINTIVNAAHFGPGTLSAPSTIVALFGANFGTVSSGGQGVFPSTDFGGVSVTSDGNAVPLFGVFGPQGQINAFVPTELPETGITSFQVRAGGKVGPACPLVLASAHPGVFRLFEPPNWARAFAAALLPGTLWLPYPESMARSMGIPFNCRATGVNPLTYCAEPVSAGDLLEIYFTGLGKATPNGDPAGQPLRTGTVAPPDGNPLYRTVTRPTITIGGVPVGDSDFLFCGLTPGSAGLYQIDIRIPAGVPTGDAVLLIITTPNGFSDAAPIAIR
jgi:uncharacterized protein (TIGR03437 family)